MMKHEKANSEAVANTNSVEMNALHELLRSVTILIKLHNQHKKPKQIIDSSFTIFSALKIEEAELKHCQIIYELLNPKGMHGMGDAFLSLFFKIVLGKDYTPNEHAQVHAEKVIKSESNPKKITGRIDIYIETSSSIYPIEVKIHADDQDNQLSRYYRYIENKLNTHFQIFYLTLDGHHPSKKSIEGLKKQDLKNIIPISFNKNILPWLYKCAEISYHFHNIYNSIHQYITLIEKLTAAQKENELLEDLFMDSIENMISLSAEYFNAARMITKNFDNVQPKKMKEIFIKITDHMQKRYKINEIDDLKTTANEIHDYYFGSKQAQDQTHPGIQFELKKIDNISLRLAFEINTSSKEDEDHFYYGIVIAESGEIGWDSDFVQEAKDKSASIFNNNIWKKQVNAIRNDSSWVWWRYLPSKTQEPNFRICDTNYLKLYNQGDFDQIMKTIFEDIDSNFESIINQGTPKDLLTTYDWTKL